MRVITQFRIFEITLIPEDQLLWPECRIELVPRDVE